MEQAAMNAQQATQAALQKHMELIGADGDKLDFLNFGNQMTCPLPTPNAKWMFRGLNKFEE